MDKNEQERREKALGYSYKGLIFESIDPFVEKEDHTFIERHSISAEQDISILSYLAGDRSKDKEIAAKDAEIAALRQAIQMLGEMRYDIMEGLKYSDYANAYGTRYEFHEWWDRPEVRRALEEKP